MKQSKVTTLIAAALSCCMCTGTVYASTGYVTADLLNVRTAQSTSADVVGTLEAGDQVTITYGPEDGWCEIYYGGDCYYVAADYISSGYSGYSYDYDSDYGYDDYDESYSSYDDGYSDDTSYDYNYDNDYDTGSDSASYSDSGSSGSGTYLGTFTLTGYCNCAECCGTAGNPTASGVMPTSGHTVAMGGVDFGTQLLINGTVYTVEDRGTPYGHVDIYFDSHSEALNFGLQYAEVYQLN